MSKKRLKGKIVSNKMQKTVVVLVERIKEDPKYKKRHHVHKRYKAHDEKGECKMGDGVIIEECRPISKDKKWRVVGRITTQSEEGPEQSEDVPVSENKERA
jgi:small subunit ribosomal protein S17